MSHVLKRTRANLHAHPEDRVSDSDAEEISALARRRGEGEPLAYILGSAHFFGRLFMVDPRVLIPRTETESLARWACAYAKALPEAGVFADWCTGSGCIAVTFLIDNPGWRGYAVDSGEDALDVARRNAEGAGVTDRLTFIHCANPAEAADVIPLHSLDILVANPPYVRKAVIAELEAQVRAYEPHEALDGGYDGSDVYRLLLGETPRFMKAGAKMVFETAGEEQIKALAAEEWSGIRYDDCFKDEFGIYRFMVWRADE